TYASARPPVAGPTPKSAKGSISGAEGGAAAAGAADVGVTELEAGPLDALHVVDLRAVQVLEAQGIHVELDAVRLEVLVHLRGLVFEVEIVLEAGAAASHDAEPEALSLQALRARNFLDLAGRERGDRNHGGNIGRTTRLCQPDWRFEQGAERVGDFGGRDGARPAPWLDTGCLKRPPRVVRSPG